MALNLLVNGITYSYPTLTDEGWGPDASNWALAITQGTLQKAGGLFALTSDVDFGPTAGLKAIYYKSRSTNIASTGQIRLSNTDTITFRNAENTGNITFGPGSTDATPAWNGVDIVGGGGSGVSSVNTLTGAVIFAAGSNVTLTPSGNTITVAASTGTPAINQLTGDVTAGPGSGSQVATLGITTTKGDIIANNGAANTRFPVGTDGQFLIADSTAPEGLNWSSSGGSFLPLTGGTLTGNLTMSSGAANQIFASTFGGGTPGYSFTGSTNTGMYNPGSGNHDLFFSVNGTTIVQIGGNGISVPVGIIEVSGSGDHLNPLYTFTQAGDTGFYLDNTTLPSKLGVTVNGNIAGLIDSTGVWTLDQVVGGNITAASQFTTSGTTSHSGYQTSSPSTGATVTCTLSGPGLLLTPAGTLATLTIKFPPTPFSGQQYFVASSQTITAATFQDSSGSSSNVIGAPSTFGGTNPGCRFFFDTTSSTWYSIG